MTIDSTNGDNQITHMVDSVLQPGLSLMTSVSDPVKTPDSNVISPVWSW
jgi:hypothetical protein